MKAAKNISRRKAIFTGFASLGGILLSGCLKKLPPTYGSILRMGDDFTYIAQRGLLNQRALAKEFSKADISSFPATGNTNPADPKQKAAYTKQYEDLHAGNFADYTLNIEGLVSKPGNYTLDELKKLGSRTQITRHTCEEGWNAIAEWTGTPLALLLKHAGILPSARYVIIYGFDNYAESIDLLDAFHPQTILAHTMNGINLPLQHGAPLRLRVETQIGYKSVKYVKGIAVTDKFVDAADDIKGGWSWYNGI